jgi:hypothetical protein
LFVTEDIAELLDGRKAFGAFPDVEAEKRIGIYCAGQLVRISQKKNDRKPDIERLVGFDEVWCFCFRRPAPGWRMLGRFLGKDKLVLLHAWDKRRLVQNYDAAAAQVVDDWKTLFGTEKAHEGDWFSDYLSGVVVDVDQPL